MCNPPPPALSLRGFALVLRTDSLAFSEDKNRKILLLSDKRKLTKCFVLCLTEDKRFAVALPNIFQFFIFEKRAKNKNVESFLYANSLSLSR